MFPLMSVYYRSVNFFGIRVKSPCASLESRAKEPCSNSNISVLNSVGCFSPWYV